MANHPGYAFDFNSIDKTAVPTRSRALLYFIFFMVLTFIYWAINAELDEITRGNGKFVPSSKNQIIQHLEGGIVSEILVRQGEQVEVGQALLRVDNRLSASSFGETRLKLEELLARKLRLEAEITGGKIQEANVASIPAELIDNEKALLQNNLDYLDNQKLIVDQQINQRRSEIAEAEVRIGNARKNKELLQKQIDMTRPMVERGIESQTDFLKLEREMVAMNDTIETTRAGLPRLRAGVAELQKKGTDLMISFQTRAQKELNEVSAMISQISEKQSALEDQVTRTLVVSPVKGIIKQMHVNTIHGVVRPGMDLIEIVPASDNLIAEAKVMPSDIAFLHPGQKAKVKVTAYDFSIYGGLDGELIDISADSLLEPNGMPYFLVRIKTGLNYLGTSEKPLPLVPGMMVSVDILTGKKTVMDYLLKPIFKAKSQALTER